MSITMTPEQVAAKIESFEQENSSTEGIFAFEAPEEPIKTPAETLEKDHENVAKSLETLPEKLEELAKSQELAKSLDLQEEPKKELYKLPATLTLDEKQEEPCWKDMECRKPFCYYIHSAPMCTKKDCSCTKRHVDQPCNFDTNCKKPDCKFEHSAAICRHNGHCNNGSCKFRHPEVQKKHNKIQTDKPKPNEVCELNNKCNDANCGKKHTYPICRHHLKGGCNLGVKCSFRHPVVYMTDKSPKKFERKPVDKKPIETVVYSPPQSPTKTVKSIVRTDDSIKLTIVEFPRNYLDKFQANGLGFEIESLLGK